MVKVKLYKNIEWNLYLKTKDFWCCGKNIIKFGLRDQYICEKCKSVYELHLKKVPVTSLKKIDLDYIDEFLGERDKHKDKIRAVREIHREMTELMNKRDIMHNSSLKYSIDENIEKKAKQMLNILENGLG